MKNTWSHTNDVPALISRRKRCHVVHFRPRFTELHFRESVVDCECSLGLKHSTCFCWKCWEVFQQNGVYSNFVLNSCVFLEDHAVSLFSVYDRLISDNGFTVQQSWYCRRKGSSQHFVKPKIRISWTSERFVTPTTFFREKGNLTNHILFEIFQDAFATSYRDIICRKNFSTKMLPLHVCVFFRYPWIQKLFLLFFLFLSYTLFRHQFFIIILGNFLL